MLPDERDHAAVQVGGGGPLQQGAGGQGGELQDR